ncbi:aldehyde dehydrogenase family protein [Streptomycetaceae bacterium NBC_01309]
MTGPVPHYLCGEWRTPTDRGSVRRHAVHGHEVFRVSTTAIDTAPAFAYARTVGVPALRRLDFAERARLITRLARHLALHRDEFVRLLAHLGAPRTDAARDIAGGLDAMRRCAAALTRHLAADGATADGRLLVHGEADAAAGANGLTLLTVAAAPPGVAVQISGFGLPVTTLLGAFARAFAAGVPAIVRPSRRTAQAAVQLARRILDCPGIPEGVLQVLSGPSDLTGHLGAHDLLCLTGTSATARRLRGRVARLPAPPRQEFGAGALDCAVLGADGAPGSAAFGMFVDRLVAGMTAHAGQTPAAARRAFVPVPLMDAVAEATAAALDGIRIGDPYAPGVDMGPLIDQDHRRGVLSAVARLRGAARTVRGTPGAVDAVARDERFGAFMPPVLLAADHPGHREPHEVEAFGPVGTLIPYLSSDDIAQALALGGRGSRGWVVTADPAAAADLVRQLAPTQGHIEVIDPLAASDGSGGPVDAPRNRPPLDHLTTTTVRASARHLAAATDRWFPGAPHVHSFTHPLRRHLGDLRVGDTVTVGPRTVTRTDIARFAELTGDHYYLHTDDAAAAEHPLFRGIVAHGFLVLSLATGMFVPPEPGPVLANRGLENLRFLAPVRPDDSLTATLTAQRITRRPGTGNGDVRWHIEVVDQDGRPVAEFDLITLTADRPAAGDKDVTHARHHHSQPV